MDTLNLLTLWMLCKSFVGSNGSAVTLYNFTGGVEESENVTYIRNLLGSPVQATHAFMMFSISFPTTKCCPVLFFNQGALQVQKYGLNDRACFDNTTLRNVLPDKRLWYFQNPDVPNYLETYDCRNDNGTMHCSGQTRLIVGFESPWIVTIGYLCDAVKVLEFAYFVQITVNQEVECTDFTPGEGPAPSSHGQCSQYYDRFALSNYVGFSLPNVELIFTTSIFDMGNCYQHALEMACRTGYPKCISSNSTHKKINAPCFRMCEDFRSGCKSIGGWDITCSPFPRTLDPALCYYRPVICPKIHIKNARIKYSHTDPQSGHPTSGTIAKIVCSRGYALQGSQTVSCLFAGVWNNKTLISCVKNDEKVTDITTWLIVLISVVVFVVLILFLLAITCSAKRRKKGTSSYIQSVASSTASLPYSIHEVTFDSPIRNPNQEQGRNTATQPIDCRTQASSDAATVQSGLQSPSSIESYVRCDPDSTEPIKSEWEYYDLENEYDLFISCNSNDTRNVLRKVVDPLRVQHTLDICFSSEFLPGTLILENVNKTLSRSKGALLAISQDFIDSPVCRYEFECAYFHFKMDDFFKLIVVLLEPFETLRNAPLDFKEYYSYYTCVDIHDRHLISKITAILRNKKINTRKIITVNNPCQSHSVR